MTTCRTGVGQSHYVTRRAGGRAGVIVLNYQVGRVCRTVYFPSCFLMLRLRHPCTNKKTIQTDYRVHTFYRLEDEGDKGGPTWCHCAITDRHRHRQRQVDLGLLIILFGGPSRTLLVPLMMMKPAEHCNVVVMTRSRR